MNTDYHDVCACGRPKPKVWAMCGWCYAQLPQPAKQLPDAQCVSQCEIQHGRMSCDYLVRRGPKKKEGKL